MAIRVLHVLNNLGSGGAESFIMNIYRAIDREKVQFDFLVRSNQNGHYVQEIQQLGGKVYILPPFPQHFLRNYILLYKFIKEHSEYSAIHVHANALIYLMPLRLAKRAGIPQRIVHSHSTKSISRISTALHVFRRERVDKYVTKRLACGMEAGKWMHGNREFEVINNGIDVMRFCHNERKKQTIRRQYQIENAYVVGHVGRFTAAKNHKFLLRVFKQFSIDNQNAVLMLIGDGESVGAIKEYARQLNVADKVLFVGSVNNVEDFLSAMDVFVFPSLYEGFPVTLIEAQANGVPCVISDTITKNVVINSNCCVCSLRDPIEAWVKEICGATRISTISARIKGYDCSVSAKRMEIIYLNKE